MLVICVVQLLKEPAALSITRKLTQKRRNLNVARMAKDSLIQVTSMNKELTQEERNLINVTNVWQHSRRQRV